MIIYILKNMISGTLYVGQTSNLAQRLRQHHHVARKGSRLRLYRAINKYGWENFKVIRKMECPEYLIDDVEISLIKSIKEDVGVNAIYNISDGGQQHKKHSEQTKRLMSKIAKEKGRIPNRLAIENSIKYNKLHPSFLGKNHSKESIKKLQEAKTDKMKPVTITSSNGDFIAWYNSINEASRDMNLYVASISTACRLKRPYKDLNINFARTICS